MHVFPSLLAGALTRGFAHFAGTAWVGMLISSVAASVLSMTVYWVSTSRAHQPTLTERSLDRRIAAELNMSPDDSVTNIADAIAGAKDKDVLNLIRVYLHDEVLERAGTSPTAASR